MLEKFFINFFKGYIKLIIFIPYYFSVPKLLATLFYPWKNTYWEKPKSGPFVLSEYLSREFFNLISSLLGLTIRLFTLLTYFIAQSLVLIFFPFTLLIFILLLPFLLLKEILFPKTKELKKLKKDFLKYRLINQENLKEVEKWFEIYLHYYRKNHQSILNKILSLPPIAEDWHLGYTPLLKKYGTEMTDKEYLQKTPEIFDREEDLKLLQEALLKQRGANVLLIGEPGVGRESLVINLAKLLHTNKSHPLLADFRIIKLSLTTVLSRYSDRLKSLNFLKELLEEAEKARNIILYIPDLPVYLNPKSNINIKPILKEFLNSPFMHIIGLATPFEYEIIINPQTDLKSIFTLITVKEMDKKTVKRILMEKIFEYEKKFNLIFTYEAAEEAPKLSDLYITDLPMPEKVFKLVEEVAAEALVKKKTIIKPEDLKTLIQEKTDFPLFLTTQLKKKLLNIDKELKRYILFQDEAIQKISLALKHAFLNLDNLKKPMASFLFLGPTGVGKTHTAKTLAYLFFGSKERFIRIDLGNVPSVTYLIGDAQAGIAGELIEKMHQHRYGVLLLDEIEKAPKDFYKILLTMLDEGYINDAFGKKLDCRFYFIIATSNAGSELFTQKEEIQISEFTNYLIKNQIFPSEILGRFDEIILYKPLPYEIIKTILISKLEKLLENYKQRFKIKDISIESLNLDFDKLLKESEYEKFGAREVDKIIKFKIEEKFLDIILKSIK